MKIPCFGIFADADIETRSNKLKSVFDHWTKKSNLMRHTFGDFHYFKKAYSEVTGKDFDYDPEIPSMRKLEKLERKIDWMENQVSKEPGLLGQWFKLPGAIMDKYPITRQFRNSLGIAGDRYRGDIEKFTSNLDQMVKSVHQEIMQNHVSSKFGISKNASIKKIRTMEDTFLKLKAVDENKAYDYYKENLNRESLFKNQGTRVIQTFHELIRNPALIYSDLSRIDPNQPRYKQDISKYSTNLVTAAHLWHSKMAPELFKKLKSGLQSYVDAMGAVNSKYGGYESIKNKLQDLIDNLKQEKHYVPTQILQVFPTLHRLNQDLYSGRVSHKDHHRNIDAYVEDMYQTVKENLTLTGHEYTKQIDRPDYMSKDVLGVIDKYAKSVIRFNFVSKASKDLLDATRKLDKIKKDEHDTQVKFLLEYIKDTHASATGLDMVRDSKYSLMARSLTAYQFMSKLGFNIRSAARNATQSFQNWIYFGTKAWREANDWAKGNENQKILQREMKKHGVFFADVEELAYKHDIAPKTRIVDKNGRKYVEEVEPSSYEQKLRIFENSKLTKIAGKPMQYIENRINRSSTFKIAFVHHFNELKRNPALIFKAVDKNPDAFKKGKSVEDKVHNEIVAKASRFAANAVKELHYDYSIYAKPKALRSPIGSVLGQFSTYSINFFEYQRKIFSEGSKDMAHGDWNSIEAKRAFRMGTFYSMISGVIAPLFNVDIGNLIQNDTLDRIEALYWYLSGEPDDVLKYKGILSDKILLQIEASDRLREDLGGNITKPSNISQEDWNNNTSKELQKIIKKIENEAANELRKFQTRKKSQYGLNPFGPTVSDIINIGNWAANLKLSEPELEELKQGYNHFEEIARLINPQIARTGLNTIPNIVNGTNVFTTLQQELGLYKPQNLPFRVGGINERRKSILAAVRKVSPEWLNDYFTPDEKTKKTKTLKIGDAEFTKEEIQELQNSLDVLKDSKQVTVNEGGY